MGLETYEHDAIVELVLNRPPVNALNSAMYEQLEGVLGELDANERARVVVLKAAPGSRVFSAGADIKEFGDLFDPDRAQAFLRRALDVANRLERLPQITLGVIDGPALGGGAELLLPCDLRIGSTRATIGFPEITVGQFPGTGGALRLPWLIGEARARSMLFLGEPVDADTAKEMGLLCEVVATEDLKDRTARLAERLASYPAPAIAAIKQSVLGGRDGDVDRGTERDAQLASGVMNSAEARAGFERFLMSRGAPRK